MRLSNETIHILAVCGFEDAIRVNRAIWSLIPYEPGNLITVGYWDRNTDRVDVIAYQAER